MPIIQYRLFFGISLILLMLYGCHAMNMSHPYMNTNTLYAACNGGKLGEASTKQIADAVCYSYLSAVIDALMVEHYQVGVSDVCLPNSDELFEQFAIAQFAKEMKSKKKGSNNGSESTVVESEVELEKIKAELRNELDGTGGTLPRLIDVLVLYRNYTKEEQLIGLDDTNRWRIALHRSPFETVSGALHEAWPCDDYDEKSDGYNIILKLLDE